MLHRWKIACSKLVLDCGDFIGYSQTVTGNKQSRIVLIGERLCLRNSQQLSLPLPYWPVVTQWAKVPVLVLVLALALLWQLVAIRSLVLQLAQALVHFASKLTLVNLIAHSRGFKNKGTLHYVQRPFAF